MAKFIGQHDNQLLFAEESRAVVIDSTLNTVVATGFTDVLRERNTWSTGEFSDQAQELANAALTSLDVVVAAAAGRMYTVPKAVQNEAQKGLDWHKEKNRGGTSVGMNSARILAKGGQIGLEKLRHIAKYFPRHEVDKKGKGWSPGDDGFPSNGRIAWALWGGDAAARWASHIVETANKSAITADGYGLPGYETLDVPIEPELTAFDDALTTTGEQGPEFLARVRMDGSGIDRLYRVDLDGSVGVWDDMDWTKLGEVGGDIWTYDKALDDVYDNVDTTHVIIDPESAIRLAAHFTESPFKPVSVEDLEPEEAYLAADAADDIDYELLDSTLVAATPPPAAAQPVGADGYTPEERAQNAEKQVRDGNGKFAKVGGRVIIDKNPRMTGTITKINGTTATVALENGQAPVDVQVKSTTAIGPQTVTQQGGSAPAVSPVDLTGILAEPRTPEDRTVAQLPGTLPPMTSDDLHQLLNDWVAYVNGQRAQKSATPDPKKVKVNDDMLDIGKTGRAIEKQTGQKIILDAYQHPLLKDWLKRKNDKGISNSLNYNPITAAANDSTEAEEPTTSTTEASEVTPDKCDVDPIYMAVVAPDDPQAVLSLIALVPASTASSQPMTYEREDGKWVRNEQMVNDLKSATPPPVVPLDTSTLNDVLNQVDMTQDDAQPAADAAAPAAAPVSASLSPDHVLTVLWGSDTATAILAAGGLDRNRGNAEKLRRYWTVGPGGAKIMWGTGGDWTRCVRHLGKFLGPRAKGYCALRHKEMTGMWTGDKKHRRIYGRTGSNSRSFSTDFLHTEEAVISAAFLRAEKIELRNRFRGVTASAENAAPGARFTIPLVIPENTESGDGRMFKEGAITIRDLPLPLLWQQESADGHSGSVVVGRIDSMERIEGGIGNAHGIFDNGTYGREAQRLVQNGFLRGVSADMDQFEAAPEEKATELGLGDDDDKVNEIKQERLIITKSRIMAVTIVPKPAFQECSINIDGAQQSEEGDVIPDGIYVDEVDPVEASALVAAGYVASSIPLAPPADWFSNPNLTQATPLSVDDSGHVFGHIASWQQDHIGMHNTRAPRSRSNYAYFHTGVVRTEEGSDISVGQLTLAGGHASLEASAAQAVKHYDDTASAIADVHAGEDQFGIWVAGSLRPGAQPEQIRALRASAPSGDWRPIKGQLELVAVCQVNVPGFPVARAMVASGQVYALVAAGALSLAKMKSDPVAELNARISNLETTLTNADLSGKREDILAKFATLKTQADEAAEFKYRNLKKADRDRAAKNGTATRDGLYPIGSVEDLKVAIRSVGRAKEEDRDRVRRHIIKRARALGRGNLIPDQWKDLATVEELSLIDQEIQSELTAKAEALSARVSEASNFAFVSKAQRPAPEKPSITASLERMRSVIAERSETGGADPKVLAAGNKISEEEAKNIINKTNPSLIADDAAPSESGKYTPKTQPRDEQGKFRLILARLRNDLGTSGNQAVLDKIKAVENLDNTGDYKAATSAAADLYNTIDRVDKGALDSSTHATLRKATSELSKTIANLPLPFSNQAQKVRFSDLPPALREMCKRFVTNVEEKLPHEKAAQVNAEIKMFMSGAEVYSQSEVNAQLNRLLRYLD